MTHAENNMKEYSGLLQYLLKVFYMFNTSIWYDNYNIIEGLVINCTNCNKIVYCEL